MTEEQIVEQLFEEVKQELDRQMQRYKTEINDQLQVHVSAGNEMELKEFVNNQKKYYEDFFSDAWGRPSTKKLSWERYEHFVKDSWSLSELKAELVHENRKKELIHLHVHQFLYGEVMNYLNSLIYDKKDLPLWEEKKHEAIIRYEKMNRKRKDGITDLTMRETIAFYEILSQFKVTLPISGDRPISNIAASICLATGYEKDSIEKEIGNLTPHDYKVAFEKIKEIANNYSPPPK